MTQRGRKFRRSIKAIRKRYRSTPLSRSIPQIMRFLVPWRKALCLTIQEKPLGCLTTATTLSSILLHTGEFLLPVARRKEGKKDPNVQYWNLPQNLWAFNTHNFRWEKKKVTSVKSETTKQCFLWNQLPSSNYITVRPALWYSRLGTLWSNECEFVSIILHHKKATHIKKPVYLTYLNKNVPFII